MQEEGTEILGVLYLLKGQGCVWPAYNVREEKRLGCLLLLLSLLSSAALNCCPGAMPPGLGVNCLGNETSQTVS